MSRWRAAWNVLKGVAPDVVPKPAVLNRSVVFVKPKSACLQWVRHELGKPANATDVTAYLLPTFEFGSKTEWLREYYDVVFMNELASFTPDERRWPTPLSYALFQQWFDVTMCDMVVDAVDEPMTAFSMEDPVFDDLDPAEIDD